MMTATERIGMVEKQNTFIDINCGIYFYFVTLHSKYVILLRLCFIYYYYINPVVIYVIVQAVQEKSSEP